MEAWILDQRFRSIKLIDVYESFLWVERYYGYGDFEIYTPMNKDLLDYVKQNYYLWMMDSDQMMIIETIRITTDIDTGDHMIISGRSLESLLDRRIVWKQTILNGKIQGQLEKILNQNAISPEITDRIIPDLIFEKSTDPEIDNIKIRIQYTGDNLYEVVDGICKLYSLGWGIRFNPDIAKFVFFLYKGEDRSYSQDKNSYVIFSSGYDNLISGNYIESDREYRNVALVAGEDEGNSRRTIVIGSASGLLRRELYVDARDLQSEDDEGNKIPDEQYIANLTTRGEEKLLQWPRTLMYEGQVEATKTFVYGKDFFKGDIVQIINQYDMQQQVRVVEVIRCQDQNGYSVYPTFSGLGEGTNDK